MSDAGLGELRRVCRKGIKMSSKVVIVSCPATCVMSDLERKNLDLPCPEALSRAGVSQDLSC